jgi:glycosyltransferase involved in cell wall biosynthesis
MPLPGRLWIVAPSYQDVASFQLLRKRLIEVVETSTRLRGTCVQFILVDDTGGTDHEIEQLASLEDVRVITPPFNLGHQRAIVCALRLVARDLGDDDLVVTMDSDGQDRPEDLLRLVAPLLDAPEDRGRLCIARRTRRRETVGFRVLYFLFRAMFWSLTGVTIRSGNYAAFRGSLARRMVLHPSFDLCYSSSLISLGIPATQVPCERGERYAGRSRMNKLRLFTHGVRMLMPFVDRIAVRALSAFTAIFGLGVLLAATVVAIKIFTSAAIPGWATAALLGILTLSFIALGNFVVLFVVFSHSRSISLSNLEETIEQYAGKPPTRPS